MEYLDMVIKLQEIYYGKIVLIQCGAFYIAIGADAIILHEKIGLKLNCAKKNMCKVGIPKNSLYKYMKKIEEIGYAYVVISFYKNELIKKYEKEGKKKENTIFCGNCEFCENIKNRKLTIYEQALKKYVEKEHKDDVLW